MCLAMASLDLNHTDANTASICIFIIPYVY